MFRFGNIVLCAVFCCLISLGQGGDVTSDTITISPTQVTEKTITTNTTTETPKPTPEPDTTTKKTTTSTTTTTTTTPKPEPTTTPAPVPPKPLPPPEQGNWSWTDDKNVTCILVQFAAQLNVTYQKSENNVTSLAYVILNVPANATASAGNCSGTEQWLRISWPVDANSTAGSNLTLTFLKNDTTKNYSLKSLDITLASQLYPNASSPVEFHHGAEWQTPLATSYRCASATQLNMTADAFSQAAARLTLTDLQEEAFRTAHGKGFSAARECGGGDIPDAVPIAVGCALGGLVVVVLVAYLVARHRSAARGYLSM